MFVFMFISKCRKIDGGRFQKSENTQHNEPSNYPPIMMMMTNFNKRTCISYTWSILFITGISLISVCLVMVWTECYASDKHEFHLQTFYVGISGGFITFMCLIFWYYYKYLFQLELERSENKLQTTLLDPRETLSFTENPMINEKRLSENSKV
jgi:hypothetical protein